MGCGVTCRGGVIRVMRAKKELLFSGSFSRGSVLFSVLPWMCDVNHSLYATGKQWFDPSQFHLTISRTKESVTGKSFISIGVHFHSFSPAHLVSLSIWGLLFSDPLLFTAVLQVGVSLFLPFPTARRHRSPSPHSFLLLLPLPTLTVQKKGAIFRAPLTV